MESVMKKRIRLLISCHDQPGIVAAISTFLNHHGANIVQSDQYSTDPEGGRFFMRVEFDQNNDSITFEALKTAFTDVAAEYKMNWRMEQASRKKRMAIFVSKEDHCLLELLWKWHSNELICDIPLVISNHDELRDVVEGYGIPYYHIPVSKERKAEAEQKQIELLHQYNIDVIVLARYMQIISSHFVDTFKDKIINIHHSFLPAFIGANPYAKAFERGVKLIGATAHFVTDDLDEGPIIEQDVLRVNHRYSVPQLRVAGRNVERVVLARAVNWYLEDKIIVYSNKTVVFS
ncbi:formyltetrahydrofolate deformylase [Halalkalibacterium halodurans]|uniref:Formyltetrahydrofolate deformylase n=2 Tax=Halalkalibacterium halodurans TaxID=86665 RepID=Q9K7U4_HALH5|nr:formyltetrahydrofolate deformylase [Halalkalibacterium halodurans]MDY7223797.1 formyltetrahydrofolate deformylase [Halalkalibacterium halodurans]MDY7243018.1 formyltetrahydrofolate deformylase [Halalkalibacterium halodurans]MED3645973.1 formyltetrahydrofolate deformylase [Halalkalibacterium halodurans]MED4079983.1 formyltetrahydrofolate deformylase [Halalkalibacterium halodurans]MED4084445.1 formyltetrahydrofolate deformylase [Halalkalibacterium halodurans]